MKREDTAGGDASRNRALHRELSQTRAGHGSGQDTGRNIQVRVKIGHKRTICQERTGYNRTGHDNAVGNADRNRGLNQEGQVSGRDT
jgi:hypothetical protein